MLRVYIMKKKNPEKSEEESLEETIEEDEKEQEEAEEDSDNYPDSSNFSFSRTAPVLVSGDETQEVPSLEQATSDSPGRTPEREEPPYSANGKVYQENYQDIGYERVKNYEQREMPQQGTRETRTQEVKTIDWRGAEHLRAQQTTEPEQIDIKPLKIDTKLPFERVERRKYKPR